MGFLRWIIGFISAICLALFAISNRHAVLFYISPLNAGLELPLYWIGLGFMVLGFLLGSFTVWINAAPARRTKRQQSKTIKALEKELETSNDQATQNTRADKPPSEFFPAIPSKAK